VTRPQRAARWQPLITQHDFVEYEGFHEDPANRYCHYAGLTLIAIAVFGMLDTLEFRFLDLTAAVWLLAATFVVDLLLVPRFAVPVAAVGGVLLIVGSLLPLAWNLSLLVLGWLFQLVGHRSERKPPAFLSGARHAFIGPRWLVTQLVKFSGREALEGWHGSNLNPDLNDLIRSFVAGLFPVAAAWARSAVARRVRRHEAEQDRLRRVYGIADQPVERYSAATRARIEALARQFPDARFAYTSGSTGEPKKILFTERRLKTFRLTAIRASIQAFSFAGVRRPSLFVLSGTQQDDSFTSLVIHENTRGSSYLRGLVEPSRYVVHPALRPLIREFGLNAVRLWLIVLSNPSAVYCTNPSTLVVFLNDLECDWMRASALVRAHATGHGLPPAEVWRTALGIAQRVVTGPYQERLRATAASAQPLALSTVSPALRFYCCWDGGYVGSFLRRLRDSLPDHILHVPMFSMSTETVETELMLADGTLRFPPIAPGVYYEFQSVSDLRDDRAPSRYLTTSELRPGLEYVMLVSDGYGLVRYLTDDVFECRALVAGLPDLAFRRRAGLEYSFTGEKVSGEQVSEVCRLLENEFLQLRNTGSQLTLFPSRPDDNGIPGYMLVVAHTADAPPTLDLVRLGAAFDTSLSRINHEFREKLGSRRLRTTEVIPVPYDELARTLAGRQRRSGRDQRAWDSQFKLTPLNTVLWEHVDDWCREGR